jgi:hypothetical protein
MLNHTSREYDLHHRKKNGMKYRGRQTLGSDSVDGTESLADAVEQRELKKWI